MRQLTVAVLDQDEQLLGYLDPDVVQISEVDELGALKSLTVTHPLLDTQALTLGPYATLLVHGNKLWRPVTGDGDSCLYVIIDKRTINPDDNTITVVAEEAATELSQLPQSGLVGWRTFLMTSRMEVIMVTVTLSTQYGLSREEPRRSPTPVP